MNVSGSLHLYSGDDKELFFVFDDAVAQDMYRDSQFNIDDLETRRVYISVGSSRFIHQRTLSFSRKQTEIKVSLCSRNTKDGLGSLTALYDWFTRRGVHPAPFGILGRLAKVRHRNGHRQNKSNESCNCVELLPRVAREPVGDGEAFRRHRTEPDRV